MQMKEQKRIALVAHDNRKKDLAEWVEWNWLFLVQHKLVCTGTTGNLIENVLNKRLKEKGMSNNLDMTKLKSGPLGGDQQLGALICEGDIDVLIFFWDTMTTQPHDVDVKALLRIATLYDVVYACSRSTADFIISSSLMESKYTTTRPDFGDYINRKL